MKSTIIAMLIGVALVGGAVALSQKSESMNSVASADNVTVVDGKQIISITAKGGYSPQLSKAKANMPTTLKVATNGTFDCSSALTIPSLDYQKNLSPTGVTEIEIPPQKAGTIFEGLCSMGMQRFEIAFE